MPKFDSQRELFAWMLLNTNATCVISGRPVPHPTADAFSHAAPKGAYPEGKLDSDNVDWMLPELHRQWHTGDISGPEWDAYKAKKIAMQQRYERERKNPGVCQERQSVG